MPWSIDRRFESMTEKHEKNRTERFQPNAKLGQLIGELVPLLKPLQSSLKFDQPKWPVAFIVGNSRSGTSVFFQWMASLGCFSYPTNFLARFAYAPYIGALIQQMLFNPDYDYQGEFSDIQSELNYSSDLGKSLGALATSEFQHFFRNYVPTFEIRNLSDEEIAQIDYDALARGLASIEAAFNQPFVTKANLLQYHAQLSAQKLPQVFWIHLKRDPLMTMQSLLLSRERYYGTRDTWWSCKPKEYPELSKLDVFRQVAGQVFYTNQAIEHELLGVGKDHCMSVQYEEFCKHPVRYYEEIVGKYSDLGYTLDHNYRGPENFECANRKKLPDTELELLKNAYDWFVKIN